MEDKVRIGLIGAGGIAGAHTAGYRRNPDTVVFAAIADPVRENAERRRGDDESVEIYDDYRTMIAEAQLDAVDICLPHHLHADAIIAAAEAGLHVLCEKPLCLTVERGRRDHRGRGAHRRHDHVRAQSAVLSRGGRGEADAGLRRPGTRVRGADHRQLLQRLHAREHGLARARRDGRRRRADRHGIPPALPAAAPRRRRRRSR